jgi:hypothetical protein
VTELEVPACWTWPVAEADHERAYQALTAATDRERERIDEERFVSWHAGRCALCGCLAGKPGRGRLVWDHDHDTGYVRGLLCGSCNTQEPHSTQPMFARYRARPAAAILGFSLFYAEPSSVVGIWGSREAANEAVRRWMDDHDPELQEQHDPARRR